MGSLKAWSLGSPVLIGQTVYMTENIEKETNNKEKNKAIKDTKDNVDATTETKNLEKDPLDKAKATHGRKLVKFNTAEKDLLESTASLKTAGMMLPKHTEVPSQKGQESKLVRPR